MVILLTGGTGFLGEHLLKSLSNYELRVITRDKNKVENSDLDVVEMDISEDIDDNIFDGVDAFIHSAAKVGSWPSDPMKGYYQTNVEATEKLLKKAISLDIEKIIYTSSYFALGASRTKIVDEIWNNPPSFDHPYVTTKYKAGQIVDKLEAQYPILQLLPTTIIGSGIDNPISDIVLDYVNGSLPGLPGGGKNYLNFVDVEDVSHAHLLGLENYQSGKFIIGAENMTLREFLGRIGDKLDLSPPRSLPFWMAKMYAWILEKLGNPKLTRADIEITKYNYRYSTNKALNIGYQPSGIDGSIDRMLKYFKNLGKLNSKGERRVSEWLQNQ